VGRGVVYTGVEGPVEQVNHITSARGHGVYMWACVFVTVTGNAKTQVAYSLGLVLYVSVCAAAFECLCACEHFELMQPEGWDR